MGATEDEPGSLSRPVIHTASGTHDAREAELGGGGRGAPHSLRPPSHLRIPPQHTEPASHFVPCKPALLRAPGLDRGHTRDPVLMLSEPSSAPPAACPQPGPMAYPVHSEQSDCLLPSHHGLTGGFACSRQRLRSILSASWVALVLLPVHLFFTQRPDDATL